MKLFFFKALIWIFTGGLYVRGNAESTVQQLFSKPHAESAVTESDGSGLGEIDVANPLFIFR